MRSEQEMFRLILQFAREREEIRAVILNGSRANPAVPRDCFQDFDVVYGVKSTQPFIQDKSWISHFGTIAVMQEPDCSALFEDGNPPECSYGYLMQFEDGNRIDCTFQRLDWAQNHYGQDPLTVLLLDKDGLFAPPAAPNDRDYWVKRPAAKEFADCCNEFWWVATYVAKGLWRQELLFSLEHLNAYVRPMLHMMLSWEAGVRTGFTMSVGKCEKYLPALLPREHAGLLLKTYPAADSHCIWEALFAMAELFHQSAVFVAGAMGLSYDQAQEDGSLGHIRRVYAASPGRPL